MEEQANDLAYLEMLLASRETQTLLDVRWVTTVATQAWTPFGLYMKDLRLGLVLPAC